MLLNSGCQRRLSRVPWTARRSNQSIAKGNQSWIFNGRTDAEAPIFWPPDRKNWLTGEDPDAGKDWRQEKGMAENEMVGMAPPTWWTWVWLSSRSRWWTEKPGILQSMGLQRVRHDWVTELNWIEMDFAERATDWVQLQIQQEKVGFIFKEQDGDQ